MEIPKFINDYIRPRVQGDGGEIVFDSLNGNDVTLIAMADCAVCPKANHLKGWVKMEFKNKFGVDYNVIITNKRRYFQDK